MVDMCASFRNAVKGNDADHNDRSFLEEKTDEELYVLKNKQFMTVGSIKDDELLAYSKICATRLDEINASYIKNRNRKRVKTMEQYYEAHQPLETIYQVGNVKNGGVSKDVLQAMYLRYKDKETAFYKEHGITCVYLNECIHVANADREVSEATTHIHERKLILYRTESGTLEPNIDQAYKAAGFERPDISKKSSRYNNVRIPVDNELRELWLEACREIVKEQDLQINMLDYEHSPKRKNHKNTRRYVQEQMAEDQKAREEVEQMRVEYERRLAEIDEQQREIDAKQRELDDQQRELNAQQREIDAQKRDLRKLSDKLYMDGVLGLKSHLVGKFAEQVEIEEQAKKSKPSNLIRKAEKNIREVIEIDKSTDKSAENGHSGL